MANIYKELHQDIGMPIPKYGDLEKWARQGVILLNASLTVEAATPMSHSKIGWEEFTNSVIKTLSDKREGIVFILWGNFARNKKTLIDTAKHFILESAHPSPLSVTKFLGCKHFSQTNKILEQQGKQPIDWTLE